MSVIDLDQELEHLIELTESLWDGAEAARPAIVEAFEAGLSSGRLWIDNSPQFRLSSALNGNDELVQPLADRTKMDLGDDDCAYFYDALYIFDDHLTDGLRAIKGSVTQYGRWDYSRNADCLCARLTGHYADLVSSLTPNSLSREEQERIARSYPGRDAHGPGSFSTPEKLLRDQADYDRDEQGRDYYRSFFSSIYSHGLYCAEAYNTERLVDDILPVYRELRDSPLNFDNGAEILSRTVHNPFVALVNEMKPFEFSSTAEYEQAREKSRERRAALANETPQERDERVSKILDEDLDLLAIDASIEAEDKRVNLFIDSKMADFPVPGDGVEDTESELGF